LYFSLSQLSINSSVLFAVPKKGQITPTRYEILYDQLMNLTADTGKVTPVHNLVIQRDAGTFSLNTGNIYICKPIDNKIRACVFIGDGVFSFNPPNDIERGQIKRLFEKDSLNLNIQSLLLFFADTTLKELTASLKFNSGDIPSKVSDFIKKALKFEGKNNNKKADYFLMKTLLEGSNSGLFYAFFNTKWDEQFAFLINPYENEEGFLLRRTEAPFWINSMEIISQFSVRKRTLDIMHQKNFFVGEKYIINCTFSENLDFFAEATIVFRAQQDKHQWLTFELYPELIVDSVSNATNSSLLFFKGEKNPYLWAQWDSLLVREKKDTIHIFYHGDLTEIKDSVVYVKSSIGWFPYCCSQETTKRKKALYDLTFHVPEDYTLVSVGKCINHTITDKHITSHWISNKPIRNASFYLGKFKEYHFVEDSIPPVTVLVSSLGKSEMEQDVGTVITSSLRFYEHIFGKCPADSLYVVDVPYSHGLAFPGFIQISTSTFQLHSKFFQKFQIPFRAHEVAHQWWGISVDFDSYHDQWISESFAEYAALMYTQAVFKDNEKFFEFLKLYKLRILENRNYLLGKGPSMGQIYLGFRNETSFTSGDYSLCLYEKGAWVLHMLRNMMIDLNTMNEDNFYNMMKEFYTTYRGGKASTADFQRMVEKYMGEDMSWFFDQWVYGTEIPTYKFKYDVHKTTDGKFKVHCRVKTDGVSDNFKMPVPLLIKFDDRRYVRLRVMIQGKSNEFDLPFLPLEPDKILFNDLESVLCDID
jgi:hypothetical protein